MKEEEAMRLLKALLDGEGAEWIEERGFVRFRLRRGGMLWETACRAEGSVLLIYGRFPFRCGDPDKARKICDGMNRRLLRGALYLDEDGSPVYRVSAELDDVFGAEARLAAALQYSAQVVAGLWAKLSGV
jgi:hypothetical protein